MTNTTSAAAITSATGNNDTAIGSDVTVNRAAAAAKSSSTVVGVFSDSHTNMNLADVTAAASLGGSVAGTTTTESQTCDWAAKKCSMVGTGLLLRLGHSINCQSWE